MLPVLHFIERSKQASSCHSEQSEESHFLPPIFIGVRVAGGNL